MPTDFSAAPDKKPIQPPADGARLAPVHAERGKRRGFGGRWPAEPGRGVADEPAEPAAKAPAVHAAKGVVAVGDGFVVAPVVAHRTPKRVSSTLPIAIVAALIVIGGVGAAGWYAMQPHGGQGIAELTPGSSSTTALPGGGSVATQVTDAIEPATPAAPAEEAKTTTTTARNKSGAVTHKTKTTVRSTAAADAAADASATAPIPRAAPVPNAPLVLTLPPSSAPLITAPADPPPTAPAAAPPVIQTPPTA